VNYAKIFLASCIMTTVAFGAEGSISGTVKDPAQSVLPNVRIVVTNTRGGDKTEVRSGKAGDFGPIPLPSGEYEIQVTAVCFKPFSKIIQVSEGQDLHIDLLLDVSRAKNCDSR
jgi:Carboxypeptidase regulatory-like domain